MKHVLSVGDLTPLEIQEVVHLAQKLKSEFKRKGANKSVLKGKTLVMIFEKPSLRTRLSFDIGMTQLGGHTVYISPTEVGLGKRESVSDVANVVSRMGDIIIVRVFDHRDLVEMARSSRVPVINALSDLEHPCQALADALTIIECKNTIKGKKIAFVGDGNNNIVHSLALVFAMLGAHFVVASPRSYKMERGIRSRAERIAARSNGSITEVENPTRAVQDADVVYTDTWVSMGRESERKKRLTALRPYQVTDDLMALAKRDALFMHDLPTHRGQEVQASVIDGPRSVVFQQAENRLHVQKALLAMVLP